MSIFHSTRPKFTKTVVPVVLGLAVLATVQQARAQYSTNFDNYDSSSSLSGQDNGAWDTNDPFTGATYTYPGAVASNAARSIGQSDGVEGVANYQTSLNDQQAYIGGDNVNGGALPGRGVVYTFHPTNLPATSSFVFNTDYVVTRPAVDNSGNPTTTHDQFGFSFLTAGGTTSLFNINFQVASNSSTTVDNVSYNVGGDPIAGTATNSLTLNSRYHLTVNVNAVAHTFSAFIMAETPNGSITAGTPNQAIATNVPFTGDVGDFAAYWKLNNLTNAPANGGTLTGGNNTAFTAGGSNILLFDNVSTAVPEPSSYALLGAGLLGLTALVRGRRSQAA